MQIYESKGKVETISGVIDTNTGSVSIRATFPNTRNILRSLEVDADKMRRQLENAVVEEHDFARSFVWYQDRWFR